MPSALSHTLSCRPLAVGDGGRARYRDTVLAAGKAAFPDPTKKVPLAAVVASLASMAPPPLAGDGAQALARQTAASLSKAAKELAAAAAAASAAASAGAGAGAGAKTAETTATATAGGSAAPAAAWTDGIAKVLQACTWRLGDGSEAATSAANGTATATVAAAPATTAIPVRPTPLPPPAPAVAVAVVAVTPEASAASAPAAHHADADAPAAAAAHGVIALGADPLAVDGGGAKTQPGAGAVGETL